LPNDLVGGDWLGVGGKGQNGQGNAQHHSQQTHPNPPQTRRTSLNKRDYDTLRQNGSKDYSFILAARFCRRCGGL
jgi:hypothetical protein